MTATESDNARNEPEGERYTVPLAQAAFRLKWGRQTAYDAVLRGNLDGEFRNGRWYVSQDSLNKFAESKGL